MKLLDVRPRFLHANESFRSSFDLSESDQEILNCSPGITSWFSKVRSILRTAITGSISYMFLPSCLVFLSVFLVPLIGIWNTAIASSLDWLVWLMLGISMMEFILRRLILGADGQLLVISCEFLGILGIITQISALSEWHSRFYPTLQLLRAALLCSFIPRFRGNPSITSVYRAISVTVSWNVSLMVAITSIVTFVVVDRFGEDPVWMSLALPGIMIVVILCSYALISLGVRFSVLKPLEGFIERLNGLSSSMSVVVRSINVQRTSVGSVAESSLHMANENVPFEYEIRKFERIVEKLQSFHAIHEHKIEAKTDADFAIIHSTGHLNLSTHSVEHILKPLSSADSSASESLVLLVNSWEFNPLNLSLDQQNMVLDFIFCQSGFLERNRFSRFALLVRSRYRAENFYHRFEHALDVLHTVFRFLQLTEAHTFLDHADHVGLLIAALIHDVGHPGVNNQFLIDTSHELAMRFNDRSPLENYHCSLFFDLATESELFAATPPGQVRSLRRVIIDAVLHTDNAYHFAMVKDVSVFNEVNHEALLETRLDVLKKPDSRTLINKLFLHAADISNPAKPFHICREWALLVMEEFFNQGDLEKASDLPISPLNDRTRVNIPQSQLGFIEFIVAPLYAQKFKIFPVFADNCQFIVSNMVQWAAESCSQSNSDESPAIARCNKVAEAFRNLPGMCGLYVPPSFSRPLV